MKSNLKIYIVADYRKGAADGLAEFNYQTVNLLKDEFEFHFIEFNRNKLADFTSYEIVDGFHIHSFGKINKYSLAPPPLFMEWIQMLNKKDIVFHLHHIYNFNNYKIVKVLKRENLPYIITPHDSYVYGPAYKNSLTLVRRMYRNLVIHMADKFVLNNAQFIHGISNLCPAFLKNITKNKVIAVTNQVEDVGVEFNRHQILPQVCFVGRFSIQSKGIDLALDAFSRFKKAAGNMEHVKYILIGPANDDALGDIKSICNDLNLSLGEDIILAGKVPVIDKNEILKNSKVYMQLSRVEGFGLSIAQALSCFKPVIISKNVPIHEIITKHKAGYAVNDPKEAADALANLFNLNPDQYYEMALNARRCYDEEFSPKVLKPKLVSMYKEAFI